MKQTVKILDGVLDAGTYRELDRNAAAKFLAEKYDKWGSMCSAAATVTDSGETIVGRNMDLYISGKPAYVVRTETEGGYRTLGLSYFHGFGPDCGDALENGIPDDLHKCLPFLCTDVMNAEGLYVEINMRTGEADASGRSVYGCSGTNPDAAERVCAIALPRYLCEHCATVDEALSYAQTLDIYTTCAENLNWNFCFLMADATGHYGVLEIARNRLSWLDGQRAQTNFYITREFAKDERMKAGTGRYDALMRGIGAVQSEADMYALMDEVSYFQIYAPDRCRFDARSEFIGLKANWDHAYVVSEANRGEISCEIDAIAGRIRGMSRRDLQRKCAHWESVFTVVANCSKKTLFVRFFEDSARTLTLTF